MSKGILKYLRGSIWYYDFHDHYDETHVTIGKHPCVIVSGDEVNLCSNVVTVAPITSKLDYFTDIYEVRLPSVLGDKRQSSAQINQIRTVDVRDLYDFCGVLSEEFMKDIEKQLLWQFGMGDKEKFEDSEPENVVEYVPVKEEEPKVVEKPAVVTKKVVNVRQKWTGKEKRQFIEDYDKLSKEQIMAKYDLKTIKSVHQTAYLFRKQLGIKAGHVKEA